MVYCTAPYKYISILIADRNPSLNLPQLSSLSPIEVTKKKGVSVLLGSPYPFQRGGGLRLRRGLVRNRALSQLF